MRRIFGLIFISSFAVQALPQHLTTHLRTVSAEDCDRVLAEIVTTEAKDTNLKNQLNEVPKCVAFFTEKLTISSFKDKDYRKECSPLLSDFCAQHRYLSMPTITENYKTNQLKTAGTMSLGFMYGRKTAQGVKTAIDMMKKSEGDKAERTKTKNEILYDENLTTRDMCKNKGPEKCILTWQIEPLPVPPATESLCLNEAWVTKNGGPKCECKPATFDESVDEYDRPIWNPDAFPSCENKSEKECEKRNIIDSSEYNTYTKGKFIVEWAFDLSNLRRGDKGCYVKTCVKDYVKDTTETKCELGADSLCLNNNKMKPTEKLEYPVALTGTTKKDKHITAFAYKAGHTLGWDGCYISGCEAGYTPNASGTDCEVIGGGGGGGGTIIVGETCEVSHKPTSGDGKGENIGGGTIFGFKVSGGCRTLCNPDWIGTEDLGTKGKGVCIEKTSSKLPASCTDLKLLGQKGKDILSWEFDDTNCEPLCAMGTKYDSTATEIDKVCTDSTTPPGPVISPEEKACADKSSDPSLGVKSWTYRKEFKPFCHVSDCLPGYLPNPDQISCSKESGMTSEEIDCFKRNYNPTSYHKNVTAWLPEEKYLIGVYVCSPITCISDDFTSTTPPKKDGLAICKFGGSSGLPIPGISWCGKTFDSIFEPYDCR